MLFFKGQLWQNFQISRKWDLKSQQPSANPTICICISTMPPNSMGNIQKHDDVIKWKHFPRYWPFVRGIHRSPVNSPHRGQWRGALMVSLICARINGWVNNREAGDLRGHLAHYDVIVMNMAIYGVFRAVATGNISWNRLNITTPSYQYGILVIKIRRSHDRLIL